MRESIGGTWLFNIVIFFVILFTGYLSLSINHSKAFNVKDDIVKIIERKNGFSGNLNDINATNDDTIKQIVDVLKNVGYRSVSSCPKPDSGYIWYGYDRDGKRNDTNASFCIRKISKNSIGLPDTAYYQVVVFYQLDLPIINYLFKFDVKGDTKLIYN